MYHIIFLKTYWTTNAVYRILSYVDVQRSFGKFSFSILSKVWHDYPEDKYPHLLALMQNFKMCILLGNNEYLVPELLAADSPKFEWDYKSNVRFEYSYKFMPAGLMTQFIWRMYDMLEVYWKSGAIVSYKDTRLLVKIFIVERRISFWIKGKNAEELLNLVRWEFEKIHKNIQNFPSQEMFPCNCSECVDSNGPDFFKYELMIKYLDKGKTHIICNKSAEDVAIKPLLGKFNCRNKSSLD